MVLVLLTADVPIRDAVMHQHYLGYRQRQRLF
jgi:hypothetical protein